MLNILKPLALALALTAFSAVSALAQESRPALNNVGGPGQAIAPPGAQCPRTISCELSELNYLPDGYRVQSVEICGANCTTQYWVSAISDGQALLTIDPVRGGGVLAVGRTSPPDNHPPVRLVIPSYAPSDAACCPSGFMDTTYTWDGASNTLVAGDPVVTPSADFPGWDAVRSELQAESWNVAI